MDQCRGDERYSYRTSAEAASDTIDSINHSPSSSNTVPSDLGKGMRASMWGLVIPTDKLVRKAMVAVVCRAAASLEYEAVSPDDKQDKAEQQMTPKTCDPSLGHVLALTLFALCLSGSSSRTQRCLSSFGMIVC